MRWFRFLFSAFVNLTLAGCGGSDRGISIQADRPIPPVSVKIVESSATVEVTRSFQLHFNVSNTTYPTCIWTVNGVADGNATFGTITSEGLYTAPVRIPTPNTVTVKAIATADPTKSDTATITISTGLTLAPAASMVSFAASRPFSGNPTVTQPKIADPRNPSQ